MTIVIIYILCKVPLLKQLLIICEDNEITKTDTNTRCSMKKEPRYFRLNSRNSWSIFIILEPVETGMNIPQSHIIYLFNCLMTS